MVRTGAHQLSATAAAYLPARRSLRGLREAASHCQACALWQGATQTVFGEGLLRSRLVLVGGQPGDRDDREGRPMVGPAGVLLNRALVEAGLTREAVYLTNAVKHFKSEPQGRRRLRRRPTAQEICVCRPWLEAEIALIKPLVLVAMGAVAAQALQDWQPLRDARGQQLSSPRLIVTVHPRTILRAPEAEERQRTRQAFFADLRQAATFL